MRGGTVVRIGKNKTLGFPGEIFESQEGHRTTAFIDFTPEGSDNTAGTDGGTVDRRIKFSEFHLGNGRNFEPPRHEWVSGNIKAQYAFFLRQLLCIAPILHRGERRLHRRHQSGVGGDIEQAGLSVLHLLLLLHAVGDCTFNRREQFCAVAVETIHRSGKHETFHRLFIHGLIVDPFGEIEHGGKALSQLPRLDNAFYRTHPHVFYCCESEADSIFRDAEINETLVHIGGQDVDTEFPAFINEQNDLFGFCHFGGHQGGHEFRRVVGLEPRGLIREN